MTSPALDGLLDRPVLRFAPSPTGPLHLGHAFAALTAFDLARQGRGRFLVRIEDIDAARSREDVVQGIFEDLGWLGLAWEEPVRRQSEHMADYAAALERLTSSGLTYPCFCSRKDIAEAAAAPQGPAGPVYPGTCRSLTMAEREARIAEGRPFVLRLDMARALEGVSLPLLFRERGRPVAADPAAHGDVVLARRDMPASYHLCVTLDDALQGISLVTRGEDLFEATAVHRLLQTLLDLPVPDYWHHRLICDETGRRLAKRDKDKTLRALRDEGVNPAEIRARLGLAG